MVGTLGVAFRGSGEERRRKLEPFKVAGCTTPPDSRAYTEAEIAVAGALSTLDPFAAYHPCWALPHARTVLEALGEWDPTEGDGK